MLSLTNYVNIGGNTNDEFYRYKREQIILKHEHDNRCTRMMNIRKISEQVGTSIDKLLSYLKKKLCMQITNEIIYGNVKAEDIEQYIQTFINDNVLCKQCKLPEVDCIGIMRICRTCGYNQDGIYVSKKIEDIKEEDIQEYENPIGDILVSKFMRHVYNLMNTNDNPILRTIINKCWNKDTRNYDYALKIVKEFNNILKTENMEEFVIPSKKDLKCSPTV